ncbi:hypothetical protein [Hyalangium minutum]|uniref:hypothetical protein n=1 Tax=Hyalangium minutum TaxID=394096 RepID=UPI0012F9A041|nr:hypothetical protein [Hyalangium minutum]
MTRQQVMRGAVAAVLAAAGLNCGGEAGWEPPKLGVQEQSSETVMVPTGITTAARLGQGRDWVKEELRSECVRSATSVTIPLQQANLRFSSSMLREEASESLGFSLEAKARFGLVDASAKARFSRSLTSSSLSVGMFYMADYRLGIQKLDEGSLQWLVQPGSADWLSRCGDEFMLQKEVGGQLYLLYRLDFSSLSARQEFEASVGVSWPAGSVNSQVSSQASRFAGRASVHVEAFQYGGDVTRLSSILGGAAEAGRVVLDCSMTNLAPCGAFMQNAITYASAQGAGTFSDSLNSQPADRVYLFKDWGMLGVPAPVRTVGASVQQARTSLRQLFDQQVEFQERVATLKSGRLYVSPDLRSRLDAHELGVQRNLSLISDAVKRCYDQLTDPQNPTLVNDCVTGSQLSTLVSKGYDPNLTIAALNVDVRLPFVFGGMYQVDDSRSSPNDVVNPFTGTVGCPSGFTAMQFGRIYTPEHRTGANQFLCVAPQGTVQGWSFTGLFQVDDRGSAGNNVSNTFAGGLLNCPMGTGIAYRFGRATGPESLWGVNQNLCSLGTRTSEKMPLGGLYQVDDCGRNNVANPLTGTLSCPDGFATLQVGRVKTPESRCGANQYLCKAY